MYIATEPVIYAGNKDYRVNYTTQFKMFRQYFEEFLRIQATVPIVAIPQNFTYPLKIENPIPLMSRNGVSIQSHAAPLKIGFEC